MGDYQTIVTYNFSNVRVTRVEYTKPIDDGSDTYSSFVSYGSEDDD